MIDEIPVLEEACERCNSRGWYVQDGERDSCDVCEGAGFVPTEFGEKILALMRHNIRHSLAASHER